MPLSDRVPVLENLGFRVIDERSYRITPATGAASSSVRLHDMALETLDGKPVEIGLDDDRLEQCFLAIARRDAENDGYNRLVKAAALDWRGAALFRAYGAYLQQIRIPFSQSYIAETLTRHAGVTADIFALFAARFLTTAQASAEAAIRERNLGQRYILAGFTEKLDRLLPTADIVVLPSHTEGMPNVLLEAVGFRASRQLGGN